MHPLTLSKDKTTFPIWSEAYQNILTTAEFFLFHQIVFIFPSVLILQLHAVYDMF